MRTVPLYLAVALLALAPGSFAPADALATACMNKPSGLPRAQCICLENELRKVLSPDEMRVEIMAFNGKFNELRKKVKAMGQAKAEDFSTRVASVVNSGMCSK